MLTPRQTLGLTRMAFFCLCATAGVLMLGPFQGLERSLGLSDKEAHAILFFTLTCGLFLVAPQRRRVELAAVALLIGVGIELAQGATGRSMSMADVAADALGVTAATLPGLIERLRHHVRAHPYLTWREIARSDRRRSGAARRPSPAMAAKAAS